MTQQVQSLDSYEEINHQIEDCGQETMSCILLFHLIIRSQVRSRLHQSRLLLKSHLISRIAHVPHVQLLVLSQASVNICLSVTPGQNARQHVGNPDDSGLAATEETGVGLGVKND